MARQNERTLLREAKKFNRQALGEIYDRYHQGLYGYAMRLLGDECLAEDCVADTFSRFLHGLQAGAGPDEYLQAYLYRIAHNWITDVYRRQPPLPLDLDDEAHPDGGKQPEALVDHRLQKEQVRQALRALTGDQRQVILLRFYEGWEIEQVAAAVEKPAGAVKALQHRALAALKKMLLPAERDDDNAQAD